MTELPKLSVSFDVGASAKLEVKTEIPKEVTGGLVLALTDVIRPFTERRGLKADQIRLQREDVLIEIAHKARARAEIEKIELKPVPNKLLVPFLETASLEDMDKEMQDRWAALLLSASNQYNPLHLTFLDILTRLSSREVKLLEKVAFAYPAFPERHRPGGHPQRNRELIDIHIKELLVPKSDEMFQRTEAVAKRFVADHPLVYGKVLHASVRIVGGNTYYHYDEELNPLGKNFDALQILERERLIEIHRVQSPLGVEVQYFDQTYLAIDFVLGCSPTARTIAAKRNVTSAGAVGGIS